MAKSKRNPLDRFTLNIGRLCHEWNDVEIRIGMAFAEIAQIPEALRSMVTALSVRDQIAAIRIALVTIANQNEHERYWCGQMGECLNYIDSVLRPRRNRYVHDYMWEGVYGVMRSSQTVKIRTAQSHQAPQIEHDVRVELIEDLRETVKGVREAWLWIEQLLVLRQHVAQARQAGDEWTIRRPEKLLKGPSGQDIPPWSDDILRRMPQISEVNLPAGLRELLESEEPWDAEP